MKMVDRLTALFPCVHDDAIAAIQLSTLSNLRRGGHQMTQQRCMFGSRLCLRGKVEFGNDQQVGGRLRVDVGKADAEIVLVHAVRRNLAFYNLAEYTVAWHWWAKNPSLALLKRYNTPKISWMHI